MRLMLEIVNSAKARHQYFLDEITRQLNPKSELPFGGYREPQLPELSDLDYVEMHTELIEAIQALSVTIRSKV